MASAHLVAALALAFAVLTAGGVSWLWHRRKVRRQQRQDSWRELCLRLELVPQPGAARIATGELPETLFLLHDTGAQWLVELPLAQPLLPPGMRLLSSDAPSLPPHVRMLPLAWASASTPPGLWAWRVEGEGEAPSDRVDAPHAFLVEAARAMQAHAPLRVEPRRMIQTLRTGAVLSVKEVREAVRALDATARGWLEVAEHHGLPRVQPPPEPEPEAPRAQAPQPEPARPDASAEFVVDFNALPRATRERLVAGTSPRGEVSPILADRSFRGGPWWTCAVVGIGAFCLYLLYHQVVTGELNRPWRDEPWLNLLNCALTVFSLLAAVLVLLFQDTWRKALPFHPGRYVFPFDFVDATTRRLRITPMTALAETRREDHYARRHHTQPCYSHTTLTLRFSGRRRVEEFEIDDQARAYAAVRRLPAGSMAHLSGTEGKDEETLREFDLFHELRRQPGGLRALRDHGPVEGFGGGPLVRELPTHLRPAVLLLGAFMVSLMLSPCLLLGSDRFHDDTAFKEAQKDSSGRALNAYALGNGRHAAEARRLGMQRSLQDCETQDTEQCWKYVLSLRPVEPGMEEVRARMRSAAFKATPRTVAGWEAFLKRYPDSAEALEVRARLLPEAQLRELPTHSVVALRRFRNGNPPPGADAQAQAQLQELFAAARAGYLNEASPQNPQAVLFMSRLLTHLESSESSVVPVSFRRQLAPSLKSADSLLWQAAQDTSVTPVSGHFGASSIEWLEGHTVKALGNAFRRVLPDGLLTLVHGDPLPAQAKDTGEARPRIDIDYTVSWTGMTYKHEHSGRQFARIQFDFAVTLRMPGEQPVRVNLQVKPPKDVPVHDPDRVPSSSAVYNVMAQRAFEALREKLGTAFFRADSKTFQALAQQAP
ncbi:hypothetical protein [Corallococcus exercitus]|uniref:hypothetical protein n=1 Tax=Corallococcus exercitus TaxID=2316736 RepID=UPI0035D506AA